MSSYRISDNTETPLFSAAVSGTSPVTIGPVKVSDFQTTTFQLEWTGTLSGTIDVQGSLDGVNFRDFGATASVQPAGSAGGVLIPLYGSGMKWLQVVYTNATGSGNLTGTCLSKTR